MAINWEELVEDYFEGEARYPNFPMVYYLEGLYSPPLEELPENLQELFHYNPERARQLLTEAGYPDGFKTNMITRQDMVEPASLVKSYFADIGVDMEIKVMEYGALWSIVFGKTTELEAIWGASSWWLATSPRTVFSLILKPGHMYNWSVVDDPYINEEWAKVCNTMDLEEQKAILWPLGLYTMEQAYALHLPLGPVYTFWQPWIMQGYSGEPDPGILYNAWGWVKYAWIDQELREEMEH